MTLNSKLSLMCIDDFNTVGLNKQPVLLCWLNPACSWSNSCPASGLLRRAGPIQITYSLWWALYTAGSWWMRCQSRSVGCLCLQDEHDWNTDDVQFVWTLRGENSLLHTESACSALSAQRSQTADGSSRWPETINISNPGMFQCPRAATQPRVSFTSDPVTIGVPLSTLNNKMK